MSEPPKKSLSRSKKIIWVVVIGLTVALAVAMAIPNFVRVHDPGMRNCCINNLRQIDAAAQQFALEYGKTNGDAINFPNDLTPYLVNGKIPLCPQGGVYSLKKVGDKPTCSLSTTVTPAHVLP